MIRNDQLNVTIHKYTSATPAKGSPCDHPTLCHMHFGGYTLTLEDTTGDYRMTKKAYGHN